MAWSSAPTALSKPARTGWWGEHPTVSIPARRGWWGYSGAPKGVIGAALKTLSAAATGTHPYTGQIYVPLQPVSASLSGVREGIDATLKPATAALTSIGGGWDTVFYDDFERASLGDDYTIVLGLATITDGVLYADGDPGSEIAYVGVAAGVAQINDKRVTVTLAGVSETDWKLYVVLAYTEAPASESRYAAIGYFTTGDGAPADDWYVAAVDDYGTEWVAIDPPATGDVVAMESSDTQIRVRLNSDTLIDWTSSITPNIDAGPYLVMFTNDVGVEDLTIDAPGGGTVEPHITATLKKLQAAFTSLAPPYTDDFERAALGDQWTGDNPPTISGGNLINTAAADQWYDANYLWPVGTDSHTVTVTLDCNSAADRGFLLYSLSRGASVLVGGASGTQALAAIYCDGIFAAYAYTVWAADDTFTLDTTWNGTHHTFTVKRNGTSVLSHTDTTGYCDTMTGGDYRHTTIAVYDAVTAGGMKIADFTYDDL